MKAFEFNTRVRADGTLPVPANVTTQLEGDQAVRVIMLVPDKDEEAQWAALTADQFLKGYAESDAIYDNLPAG